MSNVFLAYQLISDELVVFNAAFDFSLIFCKRRGFLTCSLNDLKSCIFILFAFYAVHTLAFAIINLCNNFLGSVQNFTYINSISHSPRCEKAERSIKSRLKMIKLHKIPPWLNRIYLF